MLWYSLEVPPRGTFNEYPQQMFLWRNKKNIVLSNFRFEQCINDKQLTTEKGKRKVRECHNHKPQPFPDTKRKRKLTKPNKNKSNKHTKSTKIRSLFPKRGKHSQSPSTWSQMMLPAREFKFEIEIRKWLIAFVWFHQKKTKPIWTGYPLYPVKWTECIATGNTLWTSDWAQIWPGRVVLSIISQLYYNIIK